MSWPNCSDSGNGWYRRFDKVQECIDLFQCNFKSRIGWNKFAETLFPVLLKIRNRKTVSQSPVILWLWSFWLSMTQLWCEVFLGHPDSLRFPNESHLNFKTFPELKRHICVHQCNGWTGMWPARDHIETTKSYHNPRVGIDRTSTVWERKNERGATFVSSG
jgi:hypothetical protein